MKKITVKVFLVFAMLVSFVGKAQFIENFDAGIPANWTVINNGDPNTWEAATPNTGTAHSGANVARLIYSATAHEDYLITPQFTVTTGVSNRLGLWIKERSTTFPEPFDILLSTTGANAADFTTTIAAAVMPTATWSEVSYSLSAYAGQTVYIAFKSTTTDMWELYLDDITVDAAAASVPDCATNVNPLDGATDVATGNITFTWAAAPAGTAATSYDFYYGLTPGNANILVGNYTTTTANIAVNDFSTTFYWKVVAKNSAGVAVGCPEWSFITQVPPGYCLTAPFGLYPGATFTPATCDGITVNVITTAGYAGEYSNVNVTSGQTYVFKSGTADFITIGNEAGDTSIIAGSTPLTWVSNVDGIIRFYSHIDNQCGSVDVNRIRSVTCGIAPCALPVVTFAKVSDCPAATFSVTADITNMGSATSITVTDNQGGTPQTVIAPGIVSFGPYANGASVTLTATNDQSPVCNVVSSAQTQASCPAANDDFVNATAIACGGTYSGTTVGATLDEDSAPDGFGADMDSPNLWYSYTGSGFEESVTLNLCNSAYDSSVLVYTGTSGNLSLLIANDDDSTCGASLTTRSRVSFTSDGSTTYYIAVEGYNVGSTGAFNMDVTCTSVTPPAVTNQTCASALAVAVDNITVLSDNSFGDISSAQPSCDSFGSIQDVWFSFVAPAGGAVDVVVSNGTMTSANFNIYAGACGSLTAAAGTCNSNLTTETTESLTGLMPNMTYYIQVWSNAAEQGTFSLRINDPNLATRGFESDAFRAYPNPVKNILNLSYDKNITNVSVFNLLGQQVITKVVDANQSQIDMSHLANGAYMVKVTADNQVKTIKVIKE